MGLVSFYSLEDKTFHLNIFYVLCLCSCSWQSGFLFNKELWSKLCVWTCNGITGHRYLPLMELNGIIRLGLSASLLAVGHLRNQPHNLWTSQISPGPGRPPCLSKSQKNNDIQGLLTITGGSSYNTRGLIMDFKRGFTPKQCSLFKEKQSRLCICKWSHISLGTVENQNNVNFMNGSDTTGTQTMYNPWHIGELLSPDYKIVRSIKTYLFSPQKQRFWQTLKTIL